jgi:sRNA-binding carbon storage regulator CsrA
MAQLTYIKIAINAPNIKMKYLLHEIYHEIKPQEMRL